MKKTVILNGIAVGEVESTGNDEEDMEAVRAFLDARGLRKEVTPFQAAYNAALAFANTSAYLYERDLSRPPRRGQNIAPFVVNATFGIELYFKALALKHGKTLRGHKLVQLHKALPQAALDSIERVTPACARDRMLPGAPDFAGYVRQLNDIYSEWRYYYETERAGKVEIEPTIFVMQVLHAACCLADA
mgnify:CR=1 FL=1